GMHLEIRVVGVGFARQQRLELAAGHVGPELLQRLFRLVDRLLVALRLAELYHRDLAVELALDAGDVLEAVPERGPLLHYRLRASGIVPQVRILGLAVELLEPLARLVEVKDASSAARPTA